MPTELLHREKIYCQQWYNTATDEWFRLSIIPERKLDDIYTPDGGFTLHKIPNSVIKETTEFESALKDLRIGMIDTPSIDLTLSTDAMPDALKYIVLFLENSTIPDDKYYTNTWIFQSDRGSSRATWFNEFIGIQRKTPGMKLTLYRGGEVPKTDIKITLMPLARLILEQVQMKSICESAFAIDSTTGLGVLNTSGLLTSYPYDLDAVANKIRITSLTGIALEHQPYKATFRLRPLSILFYIILYEQQLLLRKYLRNESIELTYENAWGERRFPHDNVKCRNLLGTEILNPDQLYYIGKMEGTYKDESVIAGGRLDTGKEIEDSFAKYLNTFDFFGVMVENFPSCFIYYNNLAFNIETFPSGVDSIAIDTLDFSGKMHFNFVRLKENVNKTDVPASPFNLTTEQRSISILSNTNDSIEIEQGASLIRSCTAERAAKLGIVDVDKIENRTDSILSEQEFGITTLLETSFNLPESFYVGRSSLGDVIGVIATGFDSGLLYYYNGTETTPAGERHRVYKCHEVVSYITNEAGDLVTYDDVDEVNAIKETIMANYNIFVGSKLRYSFEPNGNSPLEELATQFADYYRRVLMSELQKTSGLCFSASKYVLEMFSKRNQSLIEMSLDNSVPIQSNWLGDYFSIGYWDIVDDYTPYIQSNASLISIKKNLAKGTTEVKFLTEGI